MTPVDGGGRPPQPPAKTARPVAQTGAISDVHGDLVRFGYDHDAVYIEDDNGRHLFGMAEILAVVVAIVEANNYAAEYERRMRAGK